MRQGQLDQHHDEQAPAQVIPAQGHALGQARQAVDADQRQGKITAVAAQHAKQPLEPGFGEDQRPGAKPDDPQSQPGFIPARVGVIGTKSRHGGDLGQRRVIALVGPHHAIAVAKQGPALHHPRDTFPDEGPAGQGRILAEQQVELVGREQDQSGQRQQDGHRQPGQQNAQHRPASRQVDEGDPAHAEHEADQRCLGGRENGDGNHARRHDPPEKTPPWVMQRRRRRRHKADGHARTKIVLFQPQAAPGTGEQFVHQAELRNEDGEKNRAQHHYREGQRHHLGQPRPRKSRRQHIAGQHGERQGDEAPQGARRIYRPDIRNGAQGQQDKEQRRTPQGAEHPPPADHRQGQAHQIKRIIEIADDQARRRRLGAITEQRTQPGLRKNEQDGDAAQQGKPVVAPVVFQVRPEIGERLPDIEPHRLANRPSGRLTAPPTIRLALL